MTETPSNDPQLVGDILQETGAPIGDVSDTGRTNTAKSLDLASEVADLEDRIAHAAEADRAGLVLDSGTISDLQRAHLEAKVEQQEHPPVS